MASTNITPSVANETTDIQDFALGNNVIIVLYALTIVLILTLNPLSLIALRRVASFQLTTDYQDFPGFSDSERLSSWTLFSANTIDKIYPWHVAIGSYVVHNIQSCETLDSSPFYIFTPAIDD